MGYSEKDLDIWERRLEHYKKKQERDNRFKTAVRDCYIKIVAIKKELRGQTV